MWDPRLLTTGRRVRQAITEAEGLLQGEGLFNARRAPNLARPWMTVNALAHCNLVALEQLRTAASRGHPARFDGPLPYLAGELLATAPDANELDRLQRQVLIPLELELLAGTIPSPLTAVELASMVMGALRGFASPSR